jgi:predicted DCC family thiol-disulfide oxidoreductase YuxK
MSQAPTEMRAIVYDGYCNLCSGWALFHARHPAEPPFALIAMQSDTGRALLCANGVDPDDPATFLVIDRGRCFTQSDAAMHVVTELGGVWRLFALFRIVPRQWRDALYQFLARNRYHWFGKRSTCFLRP